MCTSENASLGATIVAIRVAGSNVATRRWRGVILHLARSALGARGWWVCHARPLAAEQQYPICRWKWACFTRMYGKMGSAAGGKDAGMLMKRAHAGA